jgi:hypothetical protein
VIPAAFDHRKESVGPARRRYPTCAKRLCLIRQRMLEFDLHYIAGHEKSLIGNQMTQNSGLMRGKRGVILGVANNRLIAWGIAKANKE